MLEAFCTIRSPSDVDQLCPTCAATTHLRPSDRVAVCADQGCGLLQPGNYPHELAWLSEQLHIFEIPETATDEQIAAFNAHLQRGRTLVAGLSRYPSGELGLGWQLPTLRALLHAALLGEIASRGGDKMHGNVRDYSGARASEFVRRIREEDDELVREKVKALAAQNISDFQIAKRLKIGRATVARYLGK